MNIMSQLSVAEEFLSDRGSNFLSAVLKEAFKFLVVHHSKMGPYHLQSNGAVERFHHSLFQMIRSSSQEGQHWDELLPCLLFTCREAPCSTTGFSPFELVFGKHVHGPLDIVRQSWTPNSRSPQLATDWLLKIWDDLLKMRKLAADQQATTQERTKRWHDQPQNNHLQPRRPRPHLYPSHHLEQGLKTPGQMGRPLRGVRTSIPRDLPRRYPRQKEKDQNCACYSNEGMVTTTI